MSDRWELAARLAALHDRQRGGSDDADDAESEAVRRELAAGDDDVLAAYADAVAIRREMEAADADAAPERIAPSAPSAPAGVDGDGDTDGDGGASGGATVTPLRPRERGGWRRSPARWMALAAVLAAVALIPVLRRTGAPAGDPARVAALLQSRDAGLPSGWIDAHPFDRTRGGGGTAADTALAVRMGALLLDLELAVRARDGVSTARLAREIGERLGNVPASGPAAALYRAVEQRAGAAPDELEELLGEGREGVAGLLGRDLVGLGAWLEGARLAAFRRDAAFFSSRQTRSMLDDLADAPSLTPAARAAADRVSAALPAAGAPDWPALSAALDELMRTLGR